MSPFDLGGRGALVTGGNGGIGLGIAEGLARAGARVAIAGRDRTKTDDALSKLRTVGAEAFGLEVDVTAEGFAGPMVAEAVDRLGGLDILVNNAGVSLARRPEKLDETDWRAVIDTNLTSVFLSAKAAYPALRARGGGKIINIGSMYSIFGAEHAAAYGASKGGVVQLTKSLAVAWAQDNIQVNALLPGWIATDMTSGARARFEAFDRGIVARTPAGRWGVPADLAGAAVFLSCPASDFITGAEIAVDGGFAIQGGI